MSEQQLPEFFRKRFKVNTVDEMWYKNLTEGNIRMRRNRHIYGMLPSNPRCVNCHRPFAGIGGALLRFVPQPHPTASPECSRLVARNLVSETPGAHSGTGRGRA